MDTKTIAQMIVANGVNDVSEVMEFKSSFVALAIKLLKQNAEPIIAIKDEQQFFDVITEIINEELTDEKIKAMIDKYIPFFVKPFEGMIISQVKGIVVGLIIKTLHEQVLDKYAGETWFEKLQTAVRELVAKVG